MEKPLTIVVDEFEDALIDLVNNSGIQAFILRPIFERVLATIKQVEKNQLNFDKKMYGEFLVSKEEHDDD